MQSKLLETRMIFLYREQNIFKAFHENKVNEFLKTTISHYKFKQAILLNEGFPFGADTQIPRLQIKSVNNDVIIIFAEERLDIILNHEGSSYDFKNITNNFNNFYKFLENMGFYPTRLAFQGNYICVHQNPEQVLLNKINLKFVNPIEPILQVGERYSAGNSDFHINDTYTLKTGIQDLVTSKNKVIIITRDMNTNENNNKILDENILSLFKDKVNNFVADNKVDEYLGG